MAVAAQGFQNTELDAQEALCRYVVDRFEQPGRGGVMGSVFDDREPRPGGWQEGIRGSTSAARSAKGMRRAMLRERREFYCDHDAA